LHEKNTAFLMREPIVHPINSTNMRISPFTCIFLVAFVLSGNRGAAQALRLGLKAGAGFSTYHFDATNPDFGDLGFYGDLYFELKPVTRPIGTVAGILEYDMTKDIMLSAALQFSPRFLSASEGNEKFKRDFQMSMWYAHVPLLVHYRKRSFFIGAGGYAGLALSGKWKLTETFASPNGTSQESNSDVLDFGNELFVDDLRRPDFGLKAEIGYGFKTVRLSVAYEYGLTNYLPEGKTQDSHLGQQTLQATVAYYWLLKD
jgi:Outer membrane protein beta-barrel domain